MGLAHSFRREAPAGQPSQGVIGDFFMPWPGGRRRLPGADARGRWAGGECGSTEMNLMAEFRRARKLGGRAA